MMKIMESYFLFVQIKSYTNKKNWIMNCEIPLYESHKLFFQPWKRLVIWPEISKPKFIKRKLLAVTSFKKSLTNLKMIHLKRQKIKVGC